MTQKNLIDKLENENLELKKLLIEEKKKNKIKDELCIQQSKMAAMGEMIGNIAHQWRQPLMELSSVLMVLESKIELNGKISNSEVLEAIKKSDKLTKHMSNTIDDFRSFFSKEKEKVKFIISDQIKRVVNILSTTLNNKDIKVNIVIKSNPIILGFKNEYSQALINIITNAKDELINRKIENGHIDVKVYEENGFCITEVSDNAGGIKPEYINEIFKPFVTFDKKNGTGIGLFMTKLIVENNMNGKIVVQNENNGAKFKISLPIKS
ncbi:sensor histidine kinase [Arcobacter roscoffensis]|uniref:histidine kinase n=1 Tax=Arcobacter roscoffensis TaxID=2961520 RepID=A0ABY5E882_9BACT|nr:HAMP domain-containing sensor histidine kinase [Arcobacter roscoffensis]UTJ06923.1 HAMP domain-containing histidine kinase [Arcobacter roscoffensis]